MKKENKPEVVIVTHSSKFHTDDIFAVATLCLVLEKDFTVTVKRSRDKAIIDVADYVVDVGGEHDSERNRFDHHQEGGAGERENGIPYASFGLVWKKYGEQLCNNKIVAEKIDQKLIQPTDALDNGVQIFTSIVPHVFPYTLHSLCQSFIPSWKEGFLEIDLIFMKLVFDAKIILEREIIKTSHLFEAETNVVKAYQNSADKRLIIFDRFYPTDQFISQFSEPLFIIFPSSDDGTWILKTIQNDPEDRINRKDLPEAWAGKNGEELEKITGVYGSIFCHTNRFIAVAETKEAISALAIIALQ